MCGILFSLTSKNDPLPTEQWKRLTEINSKRGPDSQATLHRTLERSNEDLRFFSSVLHLRGQYNVPQPIHSEATGNILCWNGEVFHGLQITTGENDTQVLFDRLNKATDTDVPEVVSSIEGPFAFVFYQKSENRIWFGRDCLGRRSLLWRRTESSIVLCSAAEQWEANDERALWEELPAEGIYCIDLFGDENAPAVYRVHNHPVRLHPWTYTANDGKTNSLILPFPKLDRTLPEHKQQHRQPQEIEPVLDNVRKHAKEFCQVLDRAVKFRVADIPHHQHHLTSVDITQNIDSAATAPRVAILFSGGLDCISLAALVHRHLDPAEPIDLLNVAFENPRSENAKKKEKHHVISMYDTPDRITGRAGVTELRHIAPERNWRFVEINVPYAEAMAHRQEIVDRMFPLDTVMDLSIAMALWFASRGKGEIAVGDTMKPYQSYARVLISGLGADEQLGGYSRHREAFRCGGWSKLIDETQLDIDRISTRNLGRDDRIISDHGKEVRFPYLSTDVVDYLCRLPIDIKMDMRFDRGVGEKLLLRQVASEELGLINASKNWKRAIQFGAKTAKMTGDTRSEKGHNKLDK
ncbi:asparagine synthase-domain-containing protein [Dichotomocladium elegans]|nr:asparagine synthase-domain-containing protein [Dichotomocladium elegans]